MALGARARILATVAHTASHSATGHKIQSVLKSAQPYTATCRSAAAAPHSGLSGVCAHATSLSAGLSPNTPQPTEPDYADCARCRPGQGEPDPFRLPRLAPTDDTVHQRLQRRITDSGRTRSPIPVPGRSLFGGDRNRAVRPI